MNARLRKILLSGAMLFSVNTIVNAETAPGQDLISLYQQAVNYDAGIAAARESYLSQQQGEEIARAGLLPGVNASAQTAKTNAHTDAVVGDESFDSVTYTVSLTQPLFNLPTWHNLSAAELNSARARAVYLEAQQQLILDVASAYFNVLRAQESLIAARALETAVKRQYEQAQEQFDVGLIAITDVHEAKASYDDSKTNRIRSEGDLTLAIESLSRLTGSYNEKLYNLKASFPIEMDAGTSVESWTQSAYENNLSIKTAEYALQSLRAQLEADKAGHYPTLDLTAGYESRDLNNGGTRDNETEDKSISLNLNIPLYSGGATQATIRQTRHDVEAARHQLVSARRLAKLEARTGYINLRTNIQTVESLQQNIVSRESALEATREGYKVGTRNIVEVLDAERNYFTALSAYANARFDFVESMLALKLTAGTLSEADLEQLNAWLEPYSAVKAETAD